MLLGVSLGVMVLGTLPAVTLARGGDHKFPAAARANLCPAKRFDASFYPAPLVHLPQRLCHTIRMRSRPCASLVQHLSAACRVGVGPTVCVAAGPFRLDRLTRGAVFLLAGFDGIGFAAGLAGIR